MNIWSKYLRSCVVEPCTQSYFSSRSHYVPEQAYGNSKAAQVLMTKYLDSMVRWSISFEALVTEYQLTELSVLD